MCNVHTMTDITIILTVFKGPVIIYRLERGGGRGVRGIFFTTPWHSPDLPIKYIAFERSPLIRGGSFHDPHPLLSKPPQNIKFIASADGSKLSRTP